jgi:hypothetical protein
MSDSAKGGRLKAGAKEGPKDGEDADAQPGEGTGMSKPDMKKLLIRAQKEPVNCALAQGATGNGGLGLLLLDKTRPSKSLAGDLKKQFPDARKPCFGTVSINPDETPKVAVFTVNKPPFGLDRKLMKTLRGTGFKKVQIEKDGAEGDDAGE